MSDESSTTTSSGPSVTSILRASDSRVSKTQIGIVSGIIIGTAIGVWGAAAMVHGNHAEAIAAIHSTQMENMQSQVDRAEERGASMLELSIERCDGRVQELKESRNEFSQSLTSCLEREVVCRLPPDD